MKATKQAKMLGEYKLTPLNEYMVNNTATGKNFAVVEYMVHIYGYPDGIMSIAEWHSLPNFEES